MKQNFNINQMDKRNPFTTPNGYFEHLTERIMSQLPEENSSEQNGSACQTIELKSSKRPAHRSRIMWFISSAAAACIAGVIFFVGNSGADLPSVASGQSTQQALAQNNSYMMDETSYDEYSEYSEEALNYALVDQSDIYSYLSGAE